LLFSLGKGKLVSTILTGEDLIFHRALLVARGSLNAPQPTQFLREPAHGSPAVSRSSVAAASAAA
jgi:hypothetical protein